MAGWHHQLNGHEFEQSLGVGDGQGSLECCSSWGFKESDMTEELNWTELDCFHLILQIVLKRRDFYLLFTDKETEAQSHWLPLGGHAASSELELKSSLIIAGVFHTVDAQVWILNDWLAGLHSFPQPSYILLLMASLLAVLLVVEKCIPTPAMFSLLPLHGTSA